MKTFNYFESYGPGEKLKGNKTRISYYQTGGAVNEAANAESDEDQMRQQIVALVQAAMQGDQKAQQQIQQIMQAAQSGDQQAQAIAQVIQQVVQQMQGQAQAARFGAKLNYIHKLRTGVNKDEAVIYRKCGGKVAKKVVKKAVHGDEVLEPKPAKKNIGRRLIDAVGRQYHNLFPPYEEKIVFSPYGERLNDYRLLVKYPMTWAQAQEYFKRNTNVRNNAGATVEYGLGMSPANIYITDPENIPVPPHDVTPPLSPYPPVEAVPPPSQEQPQPGHRKPPTVIPLPPVEKDTIHYPVYVGDTVRYEIPVYDSVPYEIPVYDSVPYVIPAQETINVPDQNISGINIGSYNSNDGGSQGIKIGKVKFKQRK